MCTSVLNDQVLRILNFTPSHEGLLGRVRGRPFFGLILLESSEKERTVYIFCTFTCPLDCWRQSVSWTLHWRFMSLSSRHLQYKVHMCFASQVI